MYLPKVTLVGIAVLLLCVGILRMETAKAQETRTLHVYITHEIVSDTKDKLPVNVPGHEVVGFSCVSKPASIKLESQAVCFIATE